MFLKCDKIYCSIKGGCVIYENAFKSFANYMVWHTFSLSSGIVFNNVKITNTF